jgi:SatD family (SatD)
LYTNVHEDKKPCGGHRGCSGVERAEEYTRGAGERAGAGDKRTPAGDEFQTLLAKGANIPELIFDLRVKFWPLQLRIGIGIGVLAERIQKPVNRMGGEAFQRARQAIEAIKEGPSKYEVLTAFRTGNERFDATVNLIYALQDTLLLEGSRKQWNTMKAFRVAGGVRGAARRMRLDESTVSRNLKRGYFWQMQDAIAGLQKLIEGSKL